MTVAASNPIIRHGLRVAAAFAAFGDWGGLGEGGGVGGL